MKFGIFYEHQLPRPWNEDSEYRLLQDSLSQIELADKLGYDYAWEVEHHFLEEYSHSAAPEVFLAAASQRTKNIRLGHGIIQLTTNHPARVAERVSTLDLVSHGRVELGLGEGASATELNAFDRRYRDKRAVWEDAVRACLPMFWTENWSYKGEFFDFPPRNVLPKPRQRPHPPLWVACTQSETMEMAGKRGMGALGFQFLSSKDAAKWTRIYYNAYLDQLEKLCDYNTNPQVAMVAPFMCAPTDEEALKKSEGWTFFTFAISFYGKHGAVTPGSVNLWNEYQSWRQTPEGQRLRGGGLIGSPATIRQRLYELEEAGLDQVILLNQAGKNSHEDICASLEMFAKEVMSEFHGREGEHAEWKRKVLAREIKLSSDPDETKPNRPLSVARA